jgi:hypothetical protein
MNDVAAMVNSLQATLAALEASGQDLSANPEVQDVITQAATMVASMEPSDLTASIEEQEQQQGAALAEDLQEAQPHHAQGMSDAREDPAAAYESAQHSTAERPDADRAAQLARQAARASANPGEEEEGWVSIQRQSLAHQGPSDTRSEAREASNASETHSEAGAEDMTEVEMQQAVAELEALVRAAEAAGAADAA